MTNLRHRLPRWLRLIVGVLAAIAGLILIFRPFTSVRVLIMLIALAAVLTGFTRWTAARKTAGLLDEVVAVGWVVLGGVVAFWPGVTLRVIVLLMGAGMIIAGVADVIAAFRGAADERVASALLGAASAIFGALALLWPDVTTLVIAVVFGVRTVLFGGSELMTALRGAEPEETEEEAGRRGFFRRAGAIAGAGLVLIAALALAAFSSLLHRGAPTVDAFYDTPADVPSEPGVLIRQEPFTNKIPRDATAWRILYTTTRDEGMPALASAIVVAPRDPGAEPNAVVAWAHGTTGVARTCAPSLLPEPLESGAFFNLDSVLEQKWVLVATDYTGLGTEGVHPYIIGQGEARSVLDSIRAARQLDELNLSDQTVVWGHSQGGGAALWTGQLAPTYAPDTNVIAVAALAPAADPVRFAETVEEGLGGSIFSSFLLTGYDGAYSDVSLGDYVTTGAESVVRGLADRCLGEPAFLVSVLSSITTSMSVFSQDLGDGPLGTHLAENVPTGPFDMPLLIAQGLDDQIILAGPQAEYATGVCQSGANLDYRTYEGKDHVALVTADSALTSDLIAWTQQRFAGEPATPNC